VYHCRYNKSHARPLFARRPSSPLGDGEMRKDFLSPTFSHAHLHIGVWKSPSRLPACLPRRIYGWRMPTATSSPVHTVEATQKSGQEPFWYSKNCLRMSLFVCLSPSWQIAKAHPFPAHSRLMKGHRARLRRRRRGLRRGRRGRAGLRPTSTTPSLAACAGRIFYAWKICRPPERARASERARRPVLCSLLESVRPKVSAKFGTKKNILDELSTFDGFGGGVGKTFPLSFFAFGKSSFFPP